MDNIAYLNQISSKKPKKKNIVKKALNFKLIGIVLGALTFLIVLIAVLSNLPETETDRIPRLNLRAKNLKTLIQTYRPKIKSSTLRSDSARLETILTDITTKIPSHIKNPAEGVPSFVIEEEKQKYTDSVSALEKSIVLGLLDQTYARQISYQINILIALIDAIDKKENRPDTKTFLENSRSQIELVSPTFSNFSGI